MKIMGWPAYSNRDINPYNYLLYRQLIGLGAHIIEYSKRDILSEKYDVLHLHWPDGVLRPPSVLCLVRAAFLLIRLKVVRKQGKKIVWTVHNVKPHAECWGFVVPYFYRALLDSVDGLIFLSSASQRLMHETYPVSQHLPSLVTRHGVYDAEVPESVEQGGQLASWLSAKIRILFFGQIKSYKNVPELIAAFNGIDFDRLNSHLLIAGSPESDDLRREVVESASANDAVTLELKFIEKGYLNYLVDKATVVVLPFSEITNSGSLMLALSHGTRVITKEHRAFGEINDTIDQQAIYQYSGSLTAGLLGELLKKNWADQSIDVKKIRDIFSWGTIAQETLELYRQVKTAPLECVPKSRKLRH